MGYGFPASIAAKLRYPEKTVVCMAGDGCFQMTLNEMSTAAKHKLAIIVIVVNNGKYATIRMHQEKHYPGRVSGTEIHNPDFAALAKAYGGFGTTVKRTEDFVLAYERAVASGLLSVIELQIDDEVLSTSQTVSEVRDNGK
jgi:acetolactate synthase-1/2/3 large subunit